MGFTGCIWLSYPWRDRDLFWPVDSYNQLYRAISNSQFNNFQPTTLKQAPTWAESDELLLLCSKAAASFSWPARKQASTTWFKQPKVSEDDQSQLMRLMHLLYLIITYLYLCQHSPAERRLHPQISTLPNRRCSASARLTTSTSSCSLGACQGSPWSTQNTHIFWLIFRPVYQNVSKILKQSAAETWRNQWNQPLSNQFRSSLGTSFSMNSQAGLHCQARHNEWIKAPRKLSMEAPGWKDSSSNLGSAKLGQKWSKKTLGCNILCILYIIYHISDTLKIYWDIWWYMINEECSFFFFELADLGRNQKCPFWKRNRFHGHVE